MVSPKNGFPKNLKKDLSRPFSMKKPKVQTLRDEEKSLAKEVKDIRQYSDQLDGEKRTIGEQFHRHMMSGGTAPYHDKLAGGFLDAAGAGTRWQNLGPRGTSSGPTLPPWTGKPREAMTEPTLADAVIRASYGKSWHVCDSKGVVRGKVAQARKFVLTPEMSAFLTDLAYASLSTIESSEAAQVHMDGMRSLARAPHKLVWIEHDAPAKMRRAKEEYGARLNPDVAPDKCGWLVEQHPTIDTVFRAVQFASHSFEGDRAEYMPQPCIFGMAWSVDDSIAPPWPQLNVESRLDLPLEAILTGVTSYRSKQVTVVDGFSDRAIVRRFIRESEYNPFDEMSSDLRYLWAFLATVNSLPVLVTEAKSHRGFVAKGSYRKFVDHQVVHLQVPTKRYRKLAQQSFAEASRRRRHSVRGFWRKDWRNPPISLCQHEWKTDGSHNECTHCKGRRTWIAEHERGDASLGFVLHDYVVEHERA